MCNMSEESSGIPCCTPTSPKRSNGVSHKANVCSNELTQSHLSGNRTFCNTDRDHHDNSRRTSSSGRRNRKVIPHPEALPHSEFLRIDKQRKLRIVHINPKSRDSQFQQLMLQSMSGRGNTSRDDLCAGKIVRDVKSNSTANENSCNRANLASCSNERNRASSDTKLTESSSPVRVVAESTSTGSLPGTLPVSHQSVLDNTDDAKQSEESSYKKTDGVQLSETQSAVDSTLVTDSHGVNSDERSISKDVVLDVEGDSSIDLRRGNLNFDKTGVDNPDKQSKVLSKSGNPTCAPNDPKSSDAPVDPRDTPAHNDKQSISNSTGTPSRGSDQAAVLFFIHGVAGSSDIWLSQFEYFGELGYEIIAPDLIGHGFSSAPKIDKYYDFSEIVEDMLYMFDKFCKKRNVIVGHSYGASFATVIARKRQRYVSKLVLINGGGPIPLAPNPGLFSLPVCVLTCARPVLKHMFNKQAFHGAAESFESRDRAFDVPSYVLRHIMMGQNWPDGGEDYHKGLSVPTLLIYGAGDQLVSLDEEIVMKETIYGSKLHVVQNAGHMTMMEQPDEVNRLLQEFITDAAAMSKQESPVSPRRNLQREYTIRW